MFVNRIIAAAFVLALCGSAAFGREVRTISVSGTIVTKVAPDTLSWRIRVNEVDEDLSLAKQRNDALMRKVLEVLKERAEKPEDVQTGTLRISREYEHRNNGQRVFKGFGVRRSVTFKMRDFSGFDAFYGELVACGDVEVSFNYEATGIYEEREKTRVAAVKKAREKAGAMAAAAGAKVGKVLSIDEHPPQSANPPWMSNRISNNSMMAGGGSSPAVDTESGTLLPEAIDVRITVYATFEIK